MVARELCQAVCNDCGWRGSVQRADHEGDQIALREAREHPCRHRYAPSPWPSTVIAQVREVPREIELVAAKVEQWEETVGERVAS